jgi:hypothetical protein
MGKASFKSNRCRDEPKPRQAAVLTSKTCAIICCATGLPSGRTLRP